MSVSNSPSYLFLLKLVQQHSVSPQMLGDQVMESIYWGHTQETDEAVKSTLTIQDSKTVTEKVLLFQI